MFNWIDDYIKAGSSNVSSGELALLSHNRNPKIRLRVAENHKTPVEVLVSLAMDDDPDIRLAVGTSRHTPIHLIRHLARDHDPTVRHGIAEDINAPREVLQSLAHDDNAYVSCRARKTLDSLAKSTADAINKHHLRIALNSKKQCLA